MTRILIKHIISFIMVMTVFSMPSYAFNKTIGKGYCSIRHPIESLTTSRASCESQHIIQQQSGGGNQLNTIWINTQQHHYLDRSSCKPWETQRPIAKLFGTDNLEKAYMNGVWANGFHFLTYDHHGKGSMNLLHWDGVSHAVYAWTSLLNLPQKELNYISYQVSRLLKGSPSQIIDSIIGIFIDVIEVMFGLIYSIFGIIVGTILHPIDTLLNVIPGILMLITGTIQAAWQLITGITGIFTAGYIGGCSK